MNKLKKQDTFRLIVQAISFAFHNGYVRGWMKGEIYTGANKTFCVPGLNCYSCPGAISACPIGSLQAVLDSGDYKFSCYVFGLIAAIGMFCGRFVCGWLCPFGLVQDLIYKIPCKIKKKNLPGHNVLKYLRFVILAVFVIALPLFYRNEAGAGHPFFCMYICPSGTLLGGIPLVIAQETLRTQIGVRFAWKVFLLVLVIGASVVYYRPFCKYICPLGALYGLCNPISVYRLKVDKEKCIGCGACQRVCGMDIKTYETPNSMDCIRCGKCMAACPKGAISSTFSALISREDKERTSPDQTAQAQVSASNEETKKSNPAILVAGIADLIGALAMLYLSLSPAMGYILKGSISTKLSLFTGYLPNCVMLLPAILLGILGFEMIRTYKNREDLARMKELSRHMAIILGISILLIFLGSMLTYYIQTKSLDGVLNNSLNALKSVVVPLIIGAVCTAGSVGVCCIPEKKEQK